MASTKIDFTRKAAHCRELAEGAEDPETRETWLRMERYWLEKLSPDDPNPPLAVKI